MKQPPPAKRTSAIWNFFASVKLAIVLLIILAIVSILGTLIPQHQASMEFASRLNPTLRQIFTALDLFDMYHSVWFRILLGLLTVNLIVCSVDRFPGTWKRFRHRPAPDRQKPFEGLPEEQSCRTHEAPAEAADRVARLLETRYRKIREKERDGDRFFYADKGAFSHFGVYLVHLSILVILVGGLIGSFFGFEAFVNILEGEQTDTVMLRKTRQPLKLDFDVRCDRFTVDFYENGTPREYRSDLAFLVDGRAVEKTGVLVNHPVEFMGVTFYQASYGAAPGKMVALRISGHGDPLSLKAETGTAIQLPGEEGVFRVVDARTNIMNMGPAVLVSVAPANQKDTVDFWVFMHQEEVLQKLPGPMRQSRKFNPGAFSPYTFDLEGLESRYYTGLQVNRDPGVPIVWAGCFLMIAGLFFTFFTSHRRIWVRVLKEGDGARIEVAGMANKNPVGLERELAHLAGEIERKGR